jgi:hypothetical protein
LIAKAAFAAPEDGSAVQQVLAGLPASPGPAGGFRQADSAMVSFAVDRDQGLRVSAPGRAELWQVALCYLLAADSYWAGLVSPAVSLGSAARVSAPGRAELWQVALCYLLAADSCWAGWVCPVLAWSHSAALASA